MKICESVNVLLIEFKSLLLSKYTGFSLASGILFHVFVLLFVLNRTSKITRMLQESIGNTSCRTTMIAHVSPSLPFYTETLATVQLASRLHRLRKRKGKVRLRYEVSILSDLCFVEFWFWKFSSDTISMVDLINNLKP